MLNFQLMDTGFAHAAQSIGGGLFESELRSGDMQCQLNYGRSCLQINFFMLLQTREEEGFALTFLERQDQG